MATRKTVGSSVSEPVEKRGPVTDLVRVEDSIEEFISLRLPQVGMSKLEIKPLWGTRDGKSRYFRCNYWLWSAGIIPTRTCVHSLFVRVDSEGREKALFDLTLGH